MFRHGFLKESTIYDQEASARARISTRKIRKDTHKDLNESYIQSTTQPQVSTMSSSSSLNPDPTRTDSFNAIISMLTKLSKSNQALLSRIEKVEKRQTKVGYRHQTPPRLQGTERPSHILPHTVGVDDRHRLPSYNVTSHQPVMISTQVFVLVPLRGWPLHSWQFQPPHNLTSRMMQFCLDWRP